MYKALFTADWHLSNNLPYAKPMHDSVTDRLQQQIKTIRNITEIAKEQNVDAIYILGDLYDKRLLDAVTLKKSVHTIVDIADNVCSVYILPGNHDAHSISSKQYLVDVFDSLIHPNIVVLQAGDILDVGVEGLSFYPVPWMPLNETKKELESIHKLREENKDSLNVILMHQAVEGCVHLGWRCDEGVSFNDDKNLLVLSGHFHQSQNFKGGMYIGAPMHFNFGDVNNKCSVVIGIFDNGGVASLERIPLVKSPNFYIYTDEIKHPLNTTLYKSGDYLRIEIESTAESFIEKLYKTKKFLKEAYDKGINISFMHRLIQQNEIRLESDFTVDETRCVSEYIERFNTDKLDKQVLFDTGINFLQGVNNG